ncbi:MAG: DUF4389 domain-containing protein [Reinekea sp.]|jgi:hypothetical protein
MQREAREHHAIRILYMILFWVLLRISLIATGLISILQWVLMWFRDEPVKSLLTFSCSLKTFQQQVIAYLTFQSEDKAFPFADWPEGKAE